MPPLERNEMRLYCACCNNELTATLIPADPQQAYSAEVTDTFEGTDFHKYRMLPGLFYVDNRPECWIFNEETGDSTPSGVKKDYFTLAEQSLTGAKITNESKGCCNFDHFDVVCGSCATELGWGGNDCWQSDHVMIDASKVYKDESK